MTRVEKSTLTFLDMIFALFHSSKGLVASYTKEKQKVLLSPRKKLLADFLLLFTFCELCSLHLIQFDPKAMVQADMGVSLNFAFKHVTTKLARKKFQFDCGVSLLGKFRMDFQM